MVTATLMFEHFINLNFDNTDVELYKSIVNKNISKSESAGEVLEFLINCLEKRSSDSNNNGGRQCIPLNIIIQPLLLLELDDDNVDSPIKSLIVRLLSYALPTSEGIAVLCNVCRNHTYAYTDVGLAVGEQDADVVTDPTHMSTYQHMAIHEVVLKALSTYMNSVFSPPPYVELPGDRDSYITLSVDSNVTCTPVAYMGSLYANAEAHQAALKLY